MTKLILKNGNRPKHHLRPSRPMRPCRLLQSRRSIRSCRLPQSNRLIRPCLLPQSRRPIRPCRLPQSRRSNRSCRLPQSSRAIRPCRMPQSSRLDAATKKARIHNIWTPLCTNDLSLSRLRNPPKPLVSKRVEASKQHPRPPKLPESIFKGYIE